MYTRESLQKWSDNVYCLNEIKYDINALQFVRNQTDEMCLITVKQNGLSLQYVHKQTKLICSEAIKQTGLALQFVQNQTKEICLAAVNNNIESIIYVDTKKFPEILDKYILMTV